MMEAMNAGQSAAVNDQPDAAGRAADAKPSKSVRLAAPEPAGNSYALLREHHGLRCILQPVCSCVVCMRAQSDAQQHLLVAQPVIVIL